MSVRACARACACACEKKTPRGVWRDATPGALPQRLGAAASLLALAADSRSASRPVHGPLIRGKNRRPCGGGGPAGSAGIHRADADPGGGRRADTGGPAPPSRGAPAGVSRADECHNRRREAGPPTGGSGRVSGSLRPGLYGAGPVSGPVFVGRWAGEMQGPGGPSRVRGGAGRQVQAYLLQPLRIPVRARARVRVGVGVGVRACVRACVCSCALACVRACDVRTNG